MPISEPSQGSTGASLTWLLLAWIATIAAAAVAFVQLAREIGRVREDMETLNSVNRGADKTDAGGTAARTTGRAGRMFGALYDERPSGLDIIRQWPGVTYAALATALAVVTGGILLLDRAQGHATADTARLETGRVMVQRDSLSTVVRKMQDSLRLAAAAPVPAPARRVSVPPRVTAAPRPKRSSRAPAPAVVPPPPDAAELGQALKVSGADSARRAGGGP